LIENRLINWFQNLKKELTIFLNRVNIAHQVVGESNRSSYFEQKYYEAGFKDAVALILKSIKK